MSQPKLRIEYLILEHLGSQDPAQERFVQDLFATIRKKRLGIKGIAAYAATALAERVMYVESGNVIKPLPDLPQYAAEAKANQFWALLWYACHEGKLFLGSTFYRYSRLKRSWEKTDPYQSPAWLKIQWYRLRWILIRSR